MLSKTKNRSKPMKGCNFTSQELALAYFKPIPGSPGKYRCGCGNERIQASGTGKLIKHRYLQFSRLDKPNRPHHDTAYKL